MDDLVSRPASINTGDSLTIDFAEPVSVNGKTYDRLVLEEPTASQVERAENELREGVNIHSLRRYQITFVSVCGGVPREVIGKMKIHQLREAADFLAGFTDVGRQTGET